MEALAATVEPLGSVWGTSSNRPEKWWAEDTAASGMKRPMLRRSDGLCFDVADSYCPRCARDLGLKSGIDTSNLLGSTYQQDKFAKHTGTAPATSHPVQSVFDSKTTQYYADCIIEAIENGAVEIDDQQRLNVLFCPSTGSSLGSKFKWGQLASLPDTVLVVNTSASSNIHGFLEDSSKYTHRRCVRCGGPLF
jgi:hypothetical protein